MPLLGAKTVQGVRGGVVVSLGVPEATAPLAEGGYLVTALDVLINAGCFSAHGGGVAVAWEDRGFSR